MSETFSTLSEVMAACDALQDVAERLPTASSVEAERIHGVVHAARLQLAHVAVCEPSEAHGTANFREIRGLQALEARKDH